MKSVATNEKAAPGTAEKALLHNIEVDAHYRDSVTITPEALESEFTRCPADFAYYGELYATALRAQHYAALDLKQLEARLNLQKREELTAAAPADDKGKKKAPTVDQVSAAIETDPEWDHAKRRAIDTEIEAVRMKGRVDAIRLKRDSIVALGMQHNAELKGDPMVRAAAADRARANQI